MGLPDEGIGLPKRRSRLCLNSKRKEIHKEARLAGDPDKTSPCTNEMLTATQDAIEEGRNSAAEEMFHFENRDSLVAPVSSLYNLGNTCFLNCMLQVLRYTPGFVERLSELRQNILLEESRLEGKESQSKESDRPVWKLVLCLDNLYRQMRSKENDYKDIFPTDSAMMAIQPDVLLDQIRHLNPLFEGNYQHDAQELLRCLLGCLDDAEVELEKEKGKALEEITSHPLNKNHTNFKTGLVQNDVFEGRKRVFSSANSPTLGKKRKVKKKEQDFSANFRYPILANSLNSEKSKSLSPSLVVEGEESLEDMSDGIKRTQLKRLSQGKGVESIQQSSYLNSRTAIQDGAISREDKSGVQSIELVLNSGDAPDCRLPPCQTMNSSKVERKRMKLGIRWQLAQVDKCGKDKVNSGMSPEQKAQSKSTDKCREPVDESSVIYISDDKDDVLTLSCNNNNSAQLTFNCDSKPLLCDDVIVIDEEPIASSSDKITSCPIDQKTKNEENSPERKLSTVSEENRTQMIVLGPELTVHSPAKRDKCSHSPQLPSSRSFLSRIQGFLPSSAKKILNFSFNQTVDPRLSVPEFKTSVSQNSDVLKCETKVPESKTSVLPISDVLKCETKEKIQKETDLGNKSEFQIAQEDLCEAKLTLKRCDWLGVSPVKSISASLVLERMKNEPDTPCPVPMKRKCRSDSWEEQKGEKKCRLMERDEENSRLTDEQEGLELIKFEEKDKGGIEKRLKRRSVVENTFHGNEWSMTSMNAKMLNTNNDSEIELKKYQGCKLKPLSINLKKLDWLADSNKQSFKIQEILGKGEGGVSRQHLGRGKHLKKQQVSSCGSTLKREKVLYGCNEGCSNSQGNDNEAREKLVQGFFGGIMSHRTCCYECELTSDRPEKFLDISIPVRTRSGHQTSGSSDEDVEGNDTNNCVYKLLKSFSSRERLCNDNKYFCDQCFHLVEAEHFCFFQDLPRVLAIHLKRFDLGSFMGQVSKISDHVSVPASLPCLMMKCSHSTCYQHRYSLYAVVTHSGSSILRGHYRSYVKVTSSFNKQISLHITGSKNHLESSCDTFSQSSSASSNEDTAISANSLNSLVGATLDDVTHNNFVCSDQLQSVTEKQFDRQPNTSLVCAHPKRTEKSWWLECDDEFIRIFEESEFLDRLSGEKGSLLGTPYVLFYHQNKRS